MKQQNIGAEPPGLKGAEPRLKGSEVKGVRA